MRALGLFDLLDLLSADYSDRETFYAILAALLNALFDPSGLLQNLAKFRVKQFGCVDGAISRHASVQTAERLCAVLIDQFHDRVLVTRFIPLLLGNRAQWVGWPGHWQLHPVALFALKLFRLDSFNPHFLLLSSSCFFRQLSHCCLDDWRLNHCFGLDSVSLLFRDQFLEALGFLRVCVSGALSLLVLGSDLLNLLCLKDFVEVFW